MFNHLFENLKDIFAANPDAKGIDEPQWKGTDDICEESDAIDSCSNTL